VNDKEFERERGRGILNGDLSVPLRALKSSYAENCKWSGGKKSFELASNLITAILTSGMVTSSKSLSFCFT
jgi:hypothetical protein